MKQQDTANRSIKSVKGFSYAVILMNVLSVYSIQSLSLNFGEIYLMLLIPFLLLNRPRLFMSKALNWYLLFLLYAFIVSVFVSLSNQYVYFGDTINRLLRDTFYIALVFVFASNFFSYRFALRMFDIVSIVLSFYIILQFVVYLVFHIYIPGIISFLPSRDYASQLLRSAAIDGYLRANGFLSEPAACAQMLSVVLLLNLLPFGRNRVNWKRSILYSIAILCTVSTNGVVFLLFDYFVWLLINLKTSSSKRLTNTIIASILILLVGVFIFYNSAIVQSAFKRILTIGDSNAGSASIRVVRGFAFYNELPSIYKVFGIGFGNFLGIKEAYGIDTIYEETAEYMSMNSHLLTSVGIIGILLLSIAIFFGLRKKTIQGKALFMLFFLMGMSSSVYSQPIFVIVLSFVFYGLDKKRLLKEGIVL